MRRSLVSALAGVLLVGCGSSTGAAPLSAGPAQTSAPSPSVAAPAASAMPTACAPADSIDCRLQPVEAVGTRGALTGVVLVAKDGTSVWERAFGTNRSGQPMQVDDRLGIASIGKMFTGVAVAQLAQAGKLRFSDPVRRYVPGLPADVSKATLHQLLSHTSGLGMMSWNDGLEFEPGGFNYSNAGFNLLALVVERVSDTTFADHLEQHVFAPAGMTATAFERPQPRGAPLGMGGQLSTAPDLLRFANALVGNRLTDESMTRRITTSKVDTDFGAYGYGFGIFAGEGDEVASFGHLGEAGESISAVEINPELGYTVIVLSASGWSEIQQPLIEFQTSIRMGYYRY